MPIVLALLILAVGTFGMALSIPPVGSPFFDEPQQFTITEEICWNETEVIGKRLVGEPYIITYPYRLRIYDSDGSFKNSCESKENIEYWYPSCGNSSYCHYNRWDSCDTLYCWGVEHKIYREDCNKTYQKMEDIYDTRLVCNQVEVDELLWWHETLTYDINKYAKIWGWEAIDKKDLTIEWLDENAECKIGYNSCRTQSTSNEALEKEGKCCSEGLYKLNNYTIEVQK